MALEGRLGRYGEGLLKLKCDAGKCILEESSMTANATNRAVNAVDRLTQRIDDLANGTEKRLDDLATKAENQFGRLESAVAVPLEGALKAMEDKINQLTNGGPPLDDTPNG